VPKGVSLQLPDTIEFSVAKSFAVDFPSSTSTNNRYVIVEGLAWKSEIVGASSSLTLPSSSYFTDAIVPAGAFYRYVEFVQTDILFVPAAFHTGNSWVAFGRNQAVLTSNELGYLTTNDIIGAANVRNFEYNEEFHFVMHPSAYAKS